MKHLHRAAPLILLLAWACDGDDSTTSDANGSDTSDSTGDGNGNGSRSGNSGGGSGGGNGGES